jgi:hypothetical protein
MANKKITDLTELTEAASNDYLEIVDTSANASKKITRDNLSGWHFLTTPLTSTSWDGDSYSTTAKTLIDLSEVFGVPARAKGILVRLVARDSGSSTKICQFSLSPNAIDKSGVAIQAYLHGVPNDVYVSVNGVVPCDANGDVYYQIAASGTGTLDAIIEIWGYWL